MKLVIQDFAFTHHVLHPYSLLQVGSTGEGQMASVRSRVQVGSGSQDLPFHPEVAPKVTEIPPFGLFLHIPALLHTNSL